MLHHLGATPKTFAANIAHVILHVFFCNVLIARRLEREFLVAIVASEELLLFSGVFSVEMLTQAVHGVETVTQVTTSHCAEVLVVHLTRTKQAGFTSSLVLFIPSLNKAS